MTLGDPAFGLSARFAQIIDVVCNVLAAYDASEPTAGPWVTQIRLLLHRRLARFIALVARFNAGTLPPARPVTALPAPSERAVVERLWDPRPCERAWLWRLDQGARAYLAMFEHLLADPEMTALLAASPQAGRLLHPLWFAVSPHPFPDVLRAPRRHRSPSASAAAPDHQSPRAPRGVPRLLSFGPSGPQAGAARPLEAGPLVPG